jgi:hypothetical protein
MKNKKFTTFWIIIIIIYRTFSKAFHKRLPYRIVLQGNELTRVTVVDSGGRVCYETLVMPDNEIIDFNTRYQFVIVLSRSPLTLDRYRYNVPDIKVPNHKIPNTIVPNIGFLSNKVPKLQNS